MGMKRPQELRPLEPQSQPSGAGHLPASVPNSQFERNNEASWQPGKTPGPSHGDSDPRTGGGIAVRIGQKLPRWSLCLGGGGGDYDLTSEVACQ